MQKLAFLFTVRKKKKDKKAQMFIKAYAFWSSKVMNME